MEETVLQRLDKLARNLTPLMTGLVLVMFSVLPLQIPYYGSVSPNLGVMAVFYWVVYRPDLMPPSAAFLTGLWQDVLVGSPLGANAFILLVVHMALAAQRRFFQGKTFSVVWWAFAMITFMAAGLTWVLTMALYAVWLSPAPAFFQFLLTVALYPFVTWVFARTQHTVLRHV
jgi:rod shape-determining protein MreD